MGVMGWGMSRGGGGWSGRRCVCGGVGWEGVVGWGLEESTSALVQAKTLLQ